MSWERSFKRHFERAAGEARITLSGFPYEAAFSPEYRALISPEFAARDALRLEEVLRTGRGTADLLELPADAPTAHCRLQIYREREHSLDEIMPVLQNLNLRVVDQIRFRVEAGERRFFIRSFSVTPAAGRTEDLLRHRQTLLDALDALLSGRAENDALNGLLLLTGLSWRQIDVFRAYRNYYFQLGTRFGRFRFHQALLDNPQAARLLFRYFERRFEPGAGYASAAQREEEGLAPLRAELAAALDAVADTNADRILRDLFNLIDATLRTDFYREDGNGSALALKLGSLGVIGMPWPRPLFEIYVHAPETEGIHLRGAPVARGGIRWSDRPDDFRSEILDLMQTQQIKNTLIVPQGAKGGFVLKAPAQEPAETAARVRSAYEILIRGLLNLTDNPTGADDTGRPPAVVAYDDPDPYLVVAADKGTSRLSDTANRIAAEYGFWLGDAFASGGSRGYHHKRLGITARGAWVCVQRHCREAGLDIGTRPFTVVGIGSMDGDVFGNGMLLSENIRLRGAFGANRIFLDPDPDPRLSWRERRRLFELPNAGWEHYDPALISPGGGVFRRDAKDIPLSPEVRAWLGVRYPSVDGETLIRLLLTAPVDLLWLGGIGTYVKASGETDDAVADRGNDPVRVDAGRIRAKVVGEGANLGFTQKARIEYALAGGRINTDAVDNSGGVDLSDHEVNLKILMSLLLQRGALADETERNAWLERLTGEVMSAVLANNYEQSLCLSLDRERSLRDPEPFLELADRLVNAGLLDRAVESFPTRKEYAARAAPGLTRPELAVLMAYAKLALKRALLAGGEFRAAPWAADFLAAYFPAPIRERFGPFLREHSLAGEIAATLVCNRLIAQAGAGFLVRVDEWSPALLLRLAETYVGCDRILGGAALREKIHTLDERLPSTRQYALLLQLEDILAAWCRQELDRGGPARPEALTGRRADLARYLDYLEETLPDGERPDYRGRMGEFRELGFTSEEARLLALPDRLSEFPALADLAERTGVAPARAAGVMDAVGGYLDLKRLSALLARVQPRDRWERRAQDALLDRFRCNAIRLGHGLLQAGLDEPAHYLDRPAARHCLAHFLRLQQDLTPTAAASLIPFVALAAALEALREAVEAP